MSAEYPKMYYDGNNNTVTNQPVPINQLNNISKNNKNEWSNQLWDVCEDISECLCATFCIYCHLYQLYSKIDEG
jgi:hypothetical protein